MKTIIDAVNELQGFWSDNKSMKYLRFGHIWKFSDHMVSDEAFFTKESFNKCVDEMSLNGGLLSYDEYKERYVRVKAIEPKPELPPVYTQAMCNENELPPVGSEYLDEDGQLCRSLFHYSSFVVGEATEHPTIQQYPVFLVSRNDRVKPITPPIQLEDKQAYSFEYNANDYVGIYDAESSRFYFPSGGRVLASYCTNIKHLT